MTTHRITDLKPAFVALVLLAAGRGALADEAAPRYSEHQDLTYYLDGKGARHQIKTLADWEVRRRHVLANMQLVMGPLPDRSRLEPLAVRELESVKIGDLIRRKIEYATEPGYRLRAFLFLPAAPVQQKLPAVLCLHQTTKIGKEEPAGLGGNPNLHYALHLAQRGYVTLAPDYPSFGERDYDFDASHGYVSGTMKAIWDNMRGIDLLESRDEVDRKRIGCIGHSLGGHNTMFTSVFDTRIKALVSNCGFTRFHKYYEGKLAGWTSARYMPRIAKVYESSPDQVPFDFTEIVAAFAPRPFLASSPVRDSNFEVSGVRETIAAALPIYKLYGKPDNLQANYPDSEHDFPADAREVAYRFFDRHLKGEK
jgi:pimeloyl-ACP methyl ester carboxylesterase